VAPPAGEPRVHGAHLPKDCITAGAQSKAECDALLARPQGPPPVAPAVTGKPPVHQPPAGTLPVAPAAAQPPAATSPPQPAGPLGSKLPGVPAKLVAPLFDSAKDAQTDGGPTAGAPARSHPQRLRPAAPMGPPPANDQAAQTGIRPPTIQPIDKTKGQQIDPNANQAIGLQLPPGAQVVQPSTDDRFRPGGPGDHRHHQPGGPGAPPQGGPDFAGARSSAPDPLGLALGAIVQLGGQLIINSPGQDQQRIAGGKGDHADYERLPGNRYRETVTRPNGIRIVTIYDQSGDVLRRSRFDQNGHETVLAYFDAHDDADLSDWHDPGDDLPPLQSDIAPQDYVLDADQANESQVQRFFAQPPVEQVQRLYSIDEVKRSARIRDMVRRLEIGDLTFDTGAATISGDQVQNLDTVAKAMLALLQRNPAETFLIEGHTDAVGSEISNLQLSDARAATVAEILTDFYHIPPENLATQGYGERFLIVQTDGPEQLNRRVTIRRITPLITVADQPN
jgi:outer membrane protein OmpA-like peptidoglycan-associated protein